MPRVARKKSPESCYHIMCRSISEVNLFKNDEDKDCYLDLLKKNIDKHKCKIYAYCLMTNHIHFFLDPQGFDVSKFMHCLNTAYVIYFNKKYDRHGHLFQGRFVSKIVDNDLYAKALTAYIHNNPKDIAGFENNEHTYKYSSYGIYLGIAKDKFKLVDKSFILQQFSAKPKNAEKKYLKFVKMMKNSEILDEIDDKITEAYTTNEYKSERQIIARDLLPKDLIDKICKALGNEVNEEEIKNKFNHKSAKIRAFVIYAMRILCGYSFKKMCQYIGNISMSGVTRLTNKGYLLVGNDEKFKNAFNQILGFT